MKSALLFSASQSQPRFPTSQPIFYLLILLALFSQELEKKYVFERLFVLVVGISQPVCNLGNYLVDYSEPGKINR